MVIHYFYLIGIRIAPLETNTPLVVDTDAVLSAPFTREFFQTIGRRHAQVVQRNRVV